jgi:PEP-CTERM motif
VKNHLAAVFAALFIAGTAQAADPVVGGLTPATLSFAEYTGSTTTGEGLINSNTLYYIDEMTGALGKSWFIFFEPTNTTDMTATITFDGPITGVYTTKANLDATNVPYGAPGIDYGSSIFIGLEPMDAFSFVGNVLTIDWHSGDPGDHIRVFTAVPAVPEPETYVLFMAGLLAVGFIGRRRSRG